MGVDSKGLLSRGGALHLILRRGTVAGWEIDGARRPTRVSGQKNPMMSHEEPLYSGPGPDPQSAKPWTQPEAVNRIQHACSTPVRVSPTDGTD